MGFSCHEEELVFCQPSPVGEGGTRSVTDEELYIILSKRTLSRYVRASRCDATKYDF